MLFVTMLIHKNSSSREKLHLSWTVFSVSDFHEVAFDIRITGKQVGRDLLRPSGPPVFSAGLSPLILSSMIHSTMIVILEGSQ